jgi:hypothetical protein
MSDTDTTEVVQPDAAATDEPKTFDADYVSKLRAESAKYRTEAKANADAAKRLAEIEESAKTAEQKAAERLAELEAKVNGYETRDQINAWKAEVAEATGVPAALLAGSTKEEIEAHAAIAKPLITPAPPTGHQPIPSAGTGAALPLNGDGIESALKNALGIQ